MADEKHVSAVGRTLFVRNLPLTTSNEKLEDIFGNIGPLKKCFVVKEKGQEICKGYGYVTFSLQDDANKAKSDIKIVGGRKVHIDFADKKSKRKQQIKKDKKPVIKKSALDSSDEDEEQVAETVQEQSPEGKKRTEKSTLPEDVKAASQNNQRKVGILDLSNLPKGTSRTDLDVYLKGTSKHMLNLKFPIKDQEGKASVMFTNKATAMNALMLVKNRTIKGIKLKVDIKTQAPVMNLKKAKLIVRNLSFQCNEEKLRGVFGKFGELGEVIIPLRADGRKIGCGFVLFMQMKDAATAMKEMNAKQILGRPVAVDWALDREKYTSLSGANSAKPQDTSNKTDKSIKVEESSSDSDESDSPEDNPEPVKKKVKQVKQMPVESDSSDESEDDMSDGDENDSEEAIDDDDDNDDDASVEGDENSKGDDVDDDEDDEDEDDLSSDDDDMPKAKKRKQDGPKGPGKNELDESKTVFIRNISFDTEEEDLHEFLGQFGDIEYCRIVTDPNTEHSKGTAFVKFMSEVSTAKCLEKANTEVAIRGDSGLVLDKRKLFVIPALPRAKAEELRQPKKKDKEDRRNLYLVREGMIRPGTAGAVGLSKADLDKRMKVEQVKRNKLKDGNVFVSMTRLCVRNIPATIDDQVLRRIYLKYVDDKYAKIKECRIMRDMGQVSAKGKAKSRGYAFVEFAEHDHALKALRNTNNNPEVFGENKRLIVEFSLENRKALEVKQKRMEKGRMMKQAAAISRGENTHSKYEKSPRDPQSSKEIQSTGMSGEEAKKGVTGLPSHWGPKVRHKRRGPDKPKNKPKDKLSREKAQKRKGPEFELVTPAPEGPTAAKKKRTRNRKPRKQEQSDDFDSLVNKYKKKIMGKAAAGKRGTWGD